MQRGRSFLAGIAFSAVVILAGCGGGSGPSRPTPPPAGGFTNSSLNGTYTFSVAGSDSAGIFTMAGSFVACGCSQGTISSGAADVTNSTAALPNAMIGSNSTYQITPDGRGLARLFINSSNVGEIDIDFVLTSPAHGLVIRFDSNGTGSGSIDLMPSPLTPTDLTATPYAFSFSGGDSSNNPVSAIGAFTVDSTGAITAGVEDFNSNGSVSAQLALSGSVTLGSGTSPGQATLTTTSGSRTFSVYSIDATHLKFVENDGQDALMGDAFNQPSAAMPTGTLVFTMTGLDASVPANLFVTGGVMTSDGASAISNGSEDVNDAGVVDGGTNPANPSSFTGNFSSTGGGRYVVNLSGYVGGSVFAAYPSSAGLLMLEIDGASGGITAGAALPQTAGAGVAASQGYGLNLTGEDLSSGFPSEIDQVAEFKTTSNSISGLADQNDAGTTQTVNLNGTYSVSNGFGTTSFTSGSPNLFLYPVDGSTTLFITADQFVAAVGSFSVQSAPASAAAQPSKPRTSFAPIQRVLPHRRGQRNSFHGSAAH